jgi:arginine N-succinyltransferase
MILLREVHEDDVDALEKLAQIPGFINLPNDKEALRDLVHRSQSSFNDKLTDKMEAKFVFVAEDLETRRVVATSMIAAQHGTPDSPHFYFEVSSEEKFSETINTGFIHGTLKLKFDTNGPSEIGGLVVDPQNRNTENHVGRQVSFVRFLFLGMHRAKFKKKILAELLPPLNKKGQSPLWEAVGRRFTNMDYWEADQLCKKNKEFIFSLFPSGKIYTTFLPAEAKNAIGKVGKETEPVMHMLKKIGFNYKNQVDPFDGGPHLWANVDELTPLKNMVHTTIEFDFDVKESKSTITQRGLLSPASNKSGQFHAADVEVILDSGKIKLTKNSQALSALGIQNKDNVVFMPYY